MQHLSMFNGTEEQVKLFNDLTKFFRKRKMDLKVMQSLEPTKNIPRKRDNCSE